MIENLTNKEFIELAEQARSNEGYEAARQLIDREMARRALIILTLGSVDMPVAGVEE